VEYLKQAQAHGLYVHLRFGPYVCAEWNYGGLPVWLRDLVMSPNGTSSSSSSSGHPIFRTTDSVWMGAMTSFIDKTLEIVREAKLFGEDGGPIVMVQIENEYGNIEETYGEEGARYVAEVAEYALAKELEVPWIMCQQGEGVGTAPPAEIINACNGHYCDNWISQVDSPLPSSFSSHLSLIFLH
jgi:beta-galactosidase GanA